LHRLPRTIALIGAAVYLEAVTSADPLRIDKWIWAARLMKTRGLAAEAVKGGRVHVNGQAIKPSKDVKPGDEVEINFGQGRRVTVVVLGTAPRRGPAKEAALLYDETPESAKAREDWVAERKLATPMPTRGVGRPTKKDRRRYESERRRRA
jgi:ribosome-associated heat shock protein Hsp15